jgi:hypoxanthine phosphoribosyltransferase
MLIAQADRIRKSGLNPDIIVGVSRGGWLPARVLSDLLENPNLANVKAECYVGIGISRNEATLTQPVSRSVAGKKVLIADDVADTGKSLTLVMAHIQQQGASEVKVATLYCKPNSTVKPDFHEKETSRWIVFPWEIKETVRKIFEAHKTEAVAVRREVSKLAAAGVSKRLVNRFLLEFKEAEPC